jgi:hypothetical protein
MSSTTFGLVDDVEVTDIHIAINRDEVDLTVRHWSSNTVVGQSFPSRTNKPTPVFAPSLHYLRVLLLAGLVTCRSCYLQVLSAVKAVCADDWVG